MQWSILPNMGEDEVGQKEYCTQCNRSLLNKGGLTPSTSGVKC